MTSNYFNTFSFPFFVAGAAFSRAARLAGRPPWGPARAPFSEQPPPTRGPPAARPSTRRIRNRAQPNSPRNPRPPWGWPPRFLGNSFIKLRGMRRRRLGRSRLNRRLRN